MILGGDPIFYGRLFQVLACNITGKIMEKSKFIGRKSIGTLTMDLYFGRIYSCIYILYKLLEKSILLYV